jgi:CRP/FNR family cyclic AMP-dependent transcriptional regulator
MVKNSSTLQSALLNGNQNDQAFRNLSGEASTRLNKIGMETHYDRSEMLFSEGEMPQCVFIVRSGRIKVSVTSREGKTMIVRIAEAGHVLGLSAALGANQHEVSAEALEPCSVTAIQVTDFLGLLSRYPEAAMEATRWVLKEYQVVFSDVCRLALPTTIAGRLANLLLDWRKAGHQGHVNPSFTMTLTREEIAGMTGTSRETVSRVLQQFQREKLISIKGSSLTVLQPQALEQLAS